ncbi:transcription factor e(y)2-domain-containing protein [Chiua virens]|nr:transcription factor e(y)2-domain-containing protein [Chiua virens]
MSKPTSESDEFYSQIQRRMIESGDWDRILRQLSSKLSEHGWTDEVHLRAKERAGSMDTLSFRLILEEISQPGQATVPPAVKREVMSALRQYVKDQFEK